MSSRSIAWVFPGQGSQFVGMGKELAEAFPEVMAKFDEANDILGFDLKRLCFEGPEDQLSRTENTQPVLLTVSCALLELVKQHANLQPMFVAGHSLGEYSALVAAGAMDFASALKTVRIRGQLMEEAVPAGQGGMAAIIGLDSATVADLCAQVESGGTGHVVPATLNAPDQTVVAGEKKAVEAVVVKATEAGAKRAVHLNVSGPFHSKLLTEAGRKLGESLEDVDVQVPQIPVIANVTARPVTSPDEIRQALIDQVSSPVRWVESVEYMIEQGVDTFLEIGPGRVLSGLIRRIRRGVKTVRFDDVAGWDEILAWAKGDEVR